MDGTKGDINPKIFLQALVGLLVVMILRMLLF